MAAESRTDVSMAISAMCNRLLMMLKQCNSKTATHLKREVLHVVLECLWGVYGPCNVGNVEGFSCRVVKAKHYVNLRINSTTESPRA